MAQREETRSADKPQGLSLGRRRFIAVVFGASATLVAAALGIPLGGFFALPALRKSRRQWLEVGRASDFAEGQIKKVLANPVVPQVWPDETPPVAMYVLKHGGGKFTLFHIHCTHVGCPVRWNSQADRFFSPCHGGVFDREGRVLAGPPPRPLDRYEYKVENGIVYAGRVYKVNEDLGFTAWHHV